MTVAIEAALDAEIKALTKELETHPAWAKREAALKLRALYSTSPVEAPSSHTAAEEPDDDDAGAASRKERMAIKARILEVVDQYFGNSDGPYKTGHLFAVVTNAGLTVPGKDPRNNLSAMLSNSTEFRSTPNGWVRSPDGPAHKVTGAADVSASAAPNPGASTPDNRAPQGAMSFAGGG